MFRKNNYKKNFSIKLNLLYFVCSKLSDQLKANLQTINKINDFIDERLYHSGKNF